MVTALQGTEFAKNSIARVKYSHDAMIEMMLMEPGVSNGKLAAYFGYTEGWVSRVMNSDAFQARLAERRTEIVDPQILQSFEERIKGLANQSLDVLQAKLDATKSQDLALKTFELSTKALGMGARPQNVGPSITQTFVVALPEKVENQQDWADQARQRIPQPVQVIQDITPKGELHG